MNDKLAQNIEKFCLFRVFTKRVFLPLIAIFLIDYGHVTLADIALIASLTAIAQIIMEVPAGYVADKWGHKQALVFGTFVTTVSVLPYLFFTGFTGGLIASIMYFSGTAFISGTAQAFMHETLLALDRDREYSQIMGKAQSYGLLGNVLLVALIPLTYKIDPRLPFVLGFVCLAISFFIVSTFVPPPKRLSVSKKSSLFSLFKNRKFFVENHKTFGLMCSVLLISGIVSAGFDYATMFREVLFKNMGIPVEYFGFILSIGSLAAAVVGRYIHLLKNLSPILFYLFDTAYFCLSCILVGITNNPVVVVLAFMLFPAYGRTRDIIYQAHIFEEFPHSTYNATLVSVLNFASMIHSIWVPLLFAFIINKTSLGGGQALFGICIGLMTIPAFVLYNKWSA